MSKYYGRDDVLFKCVNEPKQRPEGQDKVTRDRIRYGSGIKKRKINELETTKNHRPIRSKERNKKVYRKIYLNSSSMF